MNNLRFYMFFTLHLSLHDGLDLHSPTMAARLCAALRGREDPLLCEVPLPFRRVFHPHGFPVQVAANSRDVLKAAELSWGSMEPMFDGPVLEVRCLVSEGKSEAVPLAPVVRAQANLLISVLDGGNFACCDLLRGSAAIWATEDVVARTEYFRYHMLEAMVYSLLDTSHLVAVHAACVSLEGHGVLLAGETGSGKSTLAYACACRGWVYTADDATWLVRKGDSRTVMGDPRRFRFRPSAGRLFPELVGREETSRANGKPTVELPVQLLPGIRTARTATVDYILFLNRKESEQAPAELSPISGDAAAARLLRNPWPSSLPGGAERLWAVRRLTEAACFEFSYCDLERAVDRIARLIRGGGR